MKDISLEEAIEIFAMGGEVFGIHEMDEKTFKLENLAMIHSYKDSLMVETEEEYNKRFIEGFYD